MEEDVLPGGDEVVAQVLDEPGFLRDVTRVGCGVESDPDPHADSAVT